MNSLPQNLEATQSRPAGKPYLIIDNLTKSFPSPKGETVVVRDFNLRVRQGEFVSLIGHSGCGKSTVLSMIAGLIEPSGGAMALADKEITGAGPDRGMEIVATIGGQVAKGFTERPGDTAYRSSGLRLQKTAVDALLKSAPQLAQQWQIGRAHV